VKREDKLTVSEAKQKLSLVHIQLFHECEPVTVSANYGAEPGKYKHRARTYICRQAQEAVTAHQELHELRTFLEAHNKDL